MAPLLWRLSQYGLKLPTSAKALQQYAERLFEKDAFQSSLSETERDFNVT
jgi:RNA polymerase-associated protein